VARGTVTLKPFVLAATGLALATFASFSGAGQDGAAGAADGAPALAPTAHPIVAREASRLWFAPSSGARSKGMPAEFGAALRWSDQEDFAKALPELVRLSSTPGPLGQYATYYAALAELRLGRAEEARRALRALQKRGLEGYLAEAAALAEAECAEALNDYGGAVEIYQRVLSAPSLAPEEVLARLGGAAKAAGDLRTAGEAFGHVVYEFPLSSVAELALREYEALPGLQRIAPGTQRYRLELGRGERLFAARRYGDARAVFQRLRSAASGDDRELVDLRLAQAAYHLKQPGAARDALRAYLEKGPRRAEALYYYALALRDLRDHAGYVKAARQVIADHPGESWAEEALNHLGTHYILVDDDDRAHAVFQELYAKYPHGRHAERAAWKAGWQSYRDRAYAAAVRYFDRAAADFPRSDYRPAWLYWSGRAYGHLKQPALAADRLRLAAADYLNSYYGRLAMRHLAGPRPAPRVVGDGAAAAAPPPNVAVVRALLEAGRYEDARQELHYAQRVWADSPAIRATLAWAQQEQGRTATGWPQFTLLRGAITTMRRAYPQFMASGGEQLPREVLTVIFPLSYWDLIRRHAAAHDLDPYLVAALIAQESTFVPDVRSRANAVGLMQLLPSTAQRLAAKVGLKYSERLLTDPEANIRMGTTYLADKLREFGALHLALASYNAGESAVRRWVQERPGVPADEFIDDIPYPETQNYVKRILGTVDDYRFLYAGRAD
jgi:soluble lytic murein transglycosylase